MDPNLVPHDTQLPYPTVILRSGYFPSDGDPGAVVDLPQPVSLS